MSGGEGQDAKKQSSPHSSPSPDDYQMVLAWSESDKCYLVTLSASQSARTHGATPEAAVRNAREVLSLHGRLAREAEREGVSLNQWIVTRLAG